MQYTDFLLEEISVSILAFANSVCSVISECFLMYIILVKSGLRTKLKKAANHRSKILLFFLIENETQEARVL